MSPPAPPRGRGSRLNPDNRFTEWQRDAGDDGWLEDAAPEAESGKGPTTTLILDQSRSVIVRNQSPDVPFTQSINPYRGCEHGCSYCFARPGHAYLGLSPGLDFETKIVWKPDAPEILRKELAAPGYRCAPIALGISTDGWQPVERRLGLSRRLLEVLAETRHPVSIVTKSALIERDADLLADMARDHLVQVMFSITTLDPLLARRLEPRAASPARRLAAMDALHRAGVPVGVLFAPLIPALNDHELERVLEAARAAGAESAGYVLLRLPLELKALFEDWLHSHFPDRATHVLSLLRQLRGGQLNDSRFGHRMRGQGVFADLYRQRMQRTCERLGFQRTHRPLNTEVFRPPPRGPQMNLF
ncbi:PA0069 family radical SAM protein [Zoogloea sp.]|uniref:PA0069 family radical SAM protein n=1 Tax=Zoogloea sp. TaxID=49181 RepID=UPI002C06938D|nr:PA0069 family radical SAM protein [Zoogloea sp.]HPI61506.1 PA0069 family radical SAM protein [Zoogloea sp.]